MNPLGVRQTPSDQADDAVHEVLRTQWQGEPAVRLDSPPGAGKTGVVERLAAQALGGIGERCMVITQTNEQAFDLARRLCQNYRRLPFWSYVRKDLPMPADLRSLANLRITLDIQTVGEGHAW